jgi:hypothetical protein
MSAGDLICNRSPGCASSSRRPTSSAALTRVARAPQAWNALEFGKAGALEALPAAELHDQLLRQRDRIGAAGIAGKERRDQLGV